MKEQKDKRRNSTNQGKEERKQNAFPKNYKITSIIVLCIQITFTQATTY